MKAVHWIFALALAAGASKTWAEPITPGATGPYNITILQGGVGMTRSLPADTSIFKANAPWSITSWVRTDVADPETVVLASLGDPNSEASARLVLHGGRLGLVTAKEALESKPALKTGAWSAVAATYDGQVLSLYLNGLLEGSVALSTQQQAPVLYLAPSLGDPGHVHHFGGAMADFQLFSATLSASSLKAMAANPPAFGQITFTEVGAGWPVQVHAWIGLQTPQDPWTLPHGKTPPTAPIQAPLLTRAALQSISEHSWSLGDWRLAAAPGVHESGERLSSLGFDDKAWYAATVPGTVLTTLIDRGVYPEPDYGLNNMAIPDTLARQDYWYRTKFTPPPQLGAQRLTLTFKGVNYAAEVWLNGMRLGDVRGAFIRGVFDVTGKVRPGQVNTLAVLVAPPPHPGIPSEESIAYGPGENGGSMTLDGPTFMPTEGWDWIPGIRDRDTGLWQAVELSASGVVRILDPTVITHLHLPKTDEADLQILVPVDNQGSDATAVTIEAAFDGVLIRKLVSLPRGPSEVQLSADEFAALKVQHPRLWWPNGYGPAALHDLTVTVRGAEGVSDVKTVRFGIREITYDLSLFDHTGRLRRVEVDPAAARGQPLIDSRHEAIKAVPNGWAQSLTPAGETSLAVRNASTTSLAPYMAIRVNGVLIAARGGSWGMDDSRKRIARERLEPYFRLHKEAHVNIIRNWLGQNTEDVFYDLADEYGMLVLNDFWESTEDFQLEAQDPALFLANARDVIQRYRGHPSIAVWFGRNEGVPQPIINEGLADLVNSIDGTRYYTGSSNRVNLQDSGPYNYRPPAAYFTDLAKGFSVEVGTPSLGTLEAIKASIPVAEQWPLSDTIAYHDWHFGGNGDVKTFMAALEKQFGAATSLEDFERKAQMMNYVDYRAIFEGFFAHLWTQNSGRLLWMTHPAWPSNHWQMYTSDYDTQASYYGVKKASEPLHVQMNLPDFSLAVVNTTRETQTGLMLTSQIVSLEGKVLATTVTPVTAGADQTTTLRPLELAPYLKTEGVVLVSLTLFDSQGVERSRNLYWQGADEGSLRRLNALAPQAVSLAAQAVIDGDEEVVKVALENKGAVPVLEAKLTLADNKGARILPAYYSDNYISLLPGERRVIELRYPRSFNGVNWGGGILSLRGWNVAPTSVGF